MDAQYTVTLSGLRETLILRRDPGVDRFAFSVGGTLSLAPDLGGGLTVLNALGGPTLSVPAPTLEESVVLGRPQAFSPASFTLSGTPGSQVLQIVFDRSFLADESRVWPLLLDPSVEIPVCSTSSCGDAHVIGTSPSSNFGTNASLGVGRSGSSIHRTYAEFPIDQGILGNKQIVTATLNLYMSNAESCSAKTYDVYRVPTDWAENTLTWNNQPSFSGISPVAGTSIASPNCPAHWVDWLVTGTVQEWANSTALNYGFMIRAANEGDNNTNSWKSFHSSEYSDPDLGPYLYVQYNTGPPNPSLVTPANGAILKSTGAVLTTSSVSDPDGDTVYYQVQVDNNSDFSSVTWESGWQPLTPTFTVPPGLLENNTVYYWRARSSDEWEQGVDGYENGWTSSRSFTYVIQNFGSREYWPMWSQGPLSVNQGTGNLVLSAPGPAYPTATGSLGAAPTYNLFDTENRGLGAGWVLDAGETLGTPPAKLIDHNASGAATRYDAVEVVYPEGQSESYSHISGSNTYRSPPGDFSELKKNADGTWTLLDEDGSLYLFGTAASDGTALLTGAEVVDAAAGIGKVVYTFAGSPPKVTEISYRLQETPTLVERALTFRWNALDGSCSTAIVCIDGPDGVTWRLIGETTTGGRLQTINNGTRTVMKITYDVSGRPVKLQNANDLDPAGASPGYNGNHSITLAYDGSGRVSSISDGPVTGQTPSTSTWTFSYVTGGGGLTAPKASHPYQPARTAWGYTEMTPPGQQGAGTPLKTRVYYDALRRTVESRDVFGNKTLSQYNERDQLAWTEEHDPAGPTNSTDHEYDPLTQVLVKVTGPDPDGSGGLPRPVTQYRYDERKIGTATTPGDPLRGLQGAYFPNKDLRGKPAARRHDANVAFDWTGAPTDSAGLPLPGMPADDFSVRWTGYVYVNANGYWFATDSDRGTRLTVDGSLAIDNWGGTGGVKESSKINLSTGWHHIALEYFDDTGASKIHLKWRWGTLGLATIPQGNLMPGWNNQTSVIDAGGHVSFQHYAKPETGKPDYALEVAGSQNHITTFEYDAAGRLTRKVMPKGNALRTINSAGDLGGSPDLRFATTWTYYGLTEDAIVPLYCGVGTAAPQSGLLKAVKHNPTASDAQTAPVTNVYDQAGRVVATTRGSGTTCRDYDSEGRLTEESAPEDNSGSIGYQYDPAGAIVGIYGVSVSDGNILTAYNEAGLPLSYEHAGSAPYIGATTTFAYNADRRPTTKTTKALGGATLSTTTMTYDAEAKIKSLTVASKTYSFFYDFRGSLKAIQMPNTTFAWRNYNRAGWLTSLYNRHGTLSDPLPTSAPSDTSPIADFTYTHDVEGKITQQSRAGAVLGTWSESYAYDALGRLAQVTLPAGTVRAYEYDMNSNRTQITEGGISVASYLYDPSLTPGVDQLTTATHGLVATTFAYDSDGQAIARGADTLAWDTRGRLKGGTFSGASLTYRFDPAGRRRVRVGPAAYTRYLYAGPEEAPAFETDYNGVITSSAVAGPAGDLAHYAGVPGPLTPVSYLYYNGHGDLAATADAAGTRTSAYTYDPFGAPREAVPTDAATERWVAQWDKKLDTITSLVEMGARPYDPVIGRFLAVDPVEGGSLNNYDYAGQDPINKYDLDGQICFSCKWRRLKAWTKRAMRWLGRQVNAFNIAWAAGTWLLYTGFRYGVVAALGLTGVGAIALGVGLIVAWWGVRKYAQSRQNARWTRSYLCSSKRPWAC